jgi:hypothetical protein
MMTAGPNLEMVQEARSCFILASMGNKLKIFLDKL